MIARNRCLTLSALALSAVFAHAEPIKRIQFPAISPDGATVIFSWQNDLWSVPRTGGTATRLTVHAAPDSRPVWFPDGSRIAFSSSRYGSVDIFSMKPDGTDLRRVTFDSGSVEYPTSVSPDGRFIYGSTNLWSRGETFRVPVAGGDLQRLTSHPFEATFAPAVTPDGSKVLYCRGSYRETAWQKMGMISSGLPEVWMADNTVPLSNHKRITNNEVTDLSPIPQADGSFFAISSRGGLPNVWRLGKDEKRLTAHLNGSCRNLSVSKTGQFAVYEFESDLYTLDTTTGAYAPIKVEVPADDRINPNIEISVTGGVNQFAVSPDGKRIAAVSRGDIFLLPERGGTTRRLTTNVGHDFGPAWLDARTILYTTNEGGKRRIKSVTIDGYVKDFAVDPKANLMCVSVSPDGKTVAFHRGESEICTVNPDGTGLKVLARGNFADAYDYGAPLFSWSPDSAYIAVNFIEGRRTQVALVDAKAGKRTDVAKMVNRPQRGSVGVPQFTPNGRSLVFSSPEYAETDLFIVDLIPNDITFTEDDLDKLDEAPKKDKPPVEVKVYEPGLASRLRRLTTTGVGAYAASPDGRGIIATTEAGLVSISSLTGAATPLIPTGPAMRVQDLFAANGKVYAINGGIPASLNLASAAPSLVPSSLNSTYLVNAKAEEKALFEEIWWQLDTNYYDPKMNGKDWAAIKTKFASIVPHAYDRTDFYRLMGEMMEELESSHLGATAPPMDYPGSGTESTAFLGIDLDPVPLARDGSAVVGRVVPGSPADHPSSMLKVGDKIMEIDGEKVAGSCYAALLNKKAGRRVTLKVERDGKSETVTIKPGSSIQRSGIEYAAWVNQQRQMVEKLSQGKLGYVHISAMDKPSLDLFLREIRTEGEGRKGLIIDVRFNGGGSTAVDVLNTLIRSPWLIRTTRGEFGLKLSENVYRSDALELPTALMCNSFSFSNAEVITEGFRKLRLGPIVGERTPGYVIGTGAATLWDGGTIRMPAIGAYAVNGENLENGGRRPDHTVWFDPNAWMEGRDVQLERTVVELLKSAK